jgi:hypothetical protein
MTLFYWVMGVMIVGTLAPAALYGVLYVVTDEPACARRARAFWAASRVFALLGFNILVWGHVLHGFWRIGFS